MKIHTTYRYKHYTSLLIDLTDFTINGIYIIMFMFGVLNNRIWQVLKFPYMYRIVLYDSHMHELKSLKIYAFLELYIYSMGITWNIYPTLSLLVLIQVGISSTLYEQGISQQCFTVALTPKKSSEQSITYILL